MTRRAYPTTLQVQAVAAQAKAVGIDRPGAIAVKPDGTIWIFDASLARRFAGEADDATQAANELEAHLGAS